MKSSTIPGYREIFPDEQKSYADLVSGISSDNILLMCAALNSELTCPEPRLEIQARLNLVVVQRLTEEQRALISRRFGIYRGKSKGRFQGIIFFRRYLVAMMLKELNNYRVIERSEEQPHQQYFFFKAYLKIIDEVNDSNYANIDFKEVDKTDPLSVFRLCWMPMLNQFEFNEKGNMIFEMLKSACLMDYASKNLTRQLKSYLSTFGFLSPGDLLNSFQSIYNVTELYEPNAMLRKHTLIKVDPETNTAHLEAQTLIPQSNGDLRFSELKKRPVYFSPQWRKHVVLDNYLAQRKVFRAPYFELFHQTDLKPQENKLKDEAYTRYSQQVADVLEKRCLKPILTLLAQEGYDAIHFDDGTDKVPDGYIRIGRMIFLFEYKAYFFPENLAQKPNFEDLKAYFDSRFIANEKGREKGIHQLRKQIEKIYEGGFEFDPEVKALLEQGSLIIYPIITYNDFYFGINGLNAYLNDTFLQSLPRECRGRLNIGPVVLINLENILDMVLTGQDVKNLETHIQNFLALISQAQYRMAISGSHSDFMQAYSGFDEIYKWQLAPPSLPLLDTHNIFERLLDLTGLSLEDLDRAIIES